MSKKKASKAKALEISNYRFASREEKCAREQDILADLQLSHEYSALFQAHGAVYDFADRQFLLAACWAGGQAQNRKE